MKFLKQAAIIFAVYLVGGFISSILPFSFPGSVISMILLFILLMTGVLDGPLGLMRGWIAGLTEPVGAWAFDLIQSFYF